MKIGIFGGSFNPIHLGHQKIVEYILAQMKLDKILVIPVGRPSHKEDFSVSGEHRFAMCKLALAGMPQVEVSDLEIRQEKTSYTYDSLQEIKAIYGEEHEYFEIIGEDSLAYFETWKEYKKILEEAKLLVLQRDDFQLASEDPRILLLQSPLFPFSATEIRKELVSQKESKALCPEVLDYIQKHQLYQKI